MGAASVGSGCYRARCSRAPGSELSGRAREWHGLAGTELTDFVTACAGLGLEVSIDGRSPWNPGNTVLLLIRSCGAVESQSQAERKDLR